MKMQLDERADDPLFSFTFLYAGFWMVLVAGGLALLWDLYRV